MSELLERWAGPRLSSSNGLALLLKTIIESLLLARPRGEREGAFQNRNVIRGGPPAAWSPSVVRNKTVPPLKRRLSDSPHTPRVPSWGSSCVGSMGCEGPGARVLVQL